MNGIGGAAAAAAERQCHSHTMPIYTH